MSVLALLGTAVLIFIGAGLAGALLEALLILPATKILIKEDELEQLGILNDQRAARGAHRSASFAATVAPGRGHILWLLVIAKNAAVFSASGFLLGSLVDKFLASGGRMEWLWYLVGALFITPMGVKNMGGMVRYWLLGLAVYVATLIYLH